MAGAEPYAYITNHQSNSISVIDTATNTVITTVNVGRYPEGVAVSPDGTKVYVTNSYYDENYGLLGGYVSILDTTTNKVTSTVDVGKYPGGIAYVFLDIFLLIKKVAGVNKWILKEVSK